MKFLFFALSIIILDIITFWGIKNSFPQFVSRYQKGIRYVFIIQSVVSLVILLGGSFQRLIGDYRLFAWYYYIFGFIVALYLPKSIYAFFLFGIRFFSIIGKRFDKFPEKSCQIVAKCGFFASAVFVFFVLWGMIFGRNNISVERVEIFADNLPEAFHGYKIVQISDVHAGSFAWSTAHFQKAVDLINLQEPDIVVCTGDIVNNFADELTPLIPVFSQLKAPDGKYAVLGNHDYGGYYDWKNLADSVANHEALKNAIEQMGFMLLNNQSVVISRCDSDRIALIGVENWGMKKRFPKRANLENAKEPVRDIPFKVLLVHDPSFWKNFVKGKTDIVLTLSGHSHGMQIGVKLGKKRYNPASMMLPRYWVGLYQTGKQYLYVNCGLGVIGFAGRIGMPPEITVITLRKTKSPEQP